MTETRRDGPIVDWKRAATRTWATESELHAADVPLGPTPLWIGTELLGGGP